MIIIWSRKRFASWPAWRWTLNGLWPTLSWRFNKEKWKDIVFDSLTTSKSGQHSRTLLCNSVLRQKTAVLNVINSYDLGACAFYGPKTICSVLSRAGLRCVLCMLPWLNMLRISLMKLCCTKITIIFHVHGPLPVVSQAVPELWNQKIVTD